jgi:hypothetical protein
MPPKKNPGGKGMRRSAKGENKNEKKNKSFCQDFVDDIVAGDSVEPLTVARVERLCGSAQMQLLTVSGEAVTASLKGALRCKKGAARSEDNTIAAFAGTTFVILQKEEYLSTIVGVLSRAHVTAIAPHFKMAPKGFFDNARPEDDEGFDWDLTGDGEGAEETGGQGPSVPDDEDVDIGKL